MVCVTSKLAEDVARNAGIPYKDAFHILLDMEHKKFKQLTVRIEMHLLTEDQKIGLEKRGLTVFEVLSGKVYGNYVNFVSSLFSEWDRKIGIKLFTILAENS